MKVLEIRPKDIYVTFELSVHQIKQILDVMEIVEFKMGGAEQESKDSLEAARKYFVDEFYKTLVQVEESLNKTGGIDGP